jgi:demethylmenaquinone methyltransferase/2-methoxy-6-polyprenyl-1,4-benzoquinol methylase
MAEDLLRFLETMASSPEAYARLRGACRAHTERHYTWERATAGLERALDRVAARGRANARSPRAGALQRRNGSAAHPECPACGESTHPSALLYRGARHRQCEACGSSLASELPSAMDLQRHYETEYPRRFAPESVTAERAGLFRSLLDRLSALGLARTERPRLLDVGGGGGHLAALARFRHWPAVSTDIASPACSVAGRDGETPAVQADGAVLPFRDGTIDAVTLINVLDQAGDPLTILREAHRVLVAGGLVALRVPNARFHRPWVRLLSSLGPLVRSREWDTYPIVHHFAFTPAGLRRLAERAGFRVLEIGNSLPALGTQPVEPIAGAALSRWGRTAITAGVAMLAGLSRDRVLIGPSVELYARKSST